MSLPGSRSPCDVLVNTDRTPSHPRLWGSCRLVCPVRAFTLARVCEPGLAAGLWVPAYTGVTAKSGLAPSGR